MTSLAPEGPTQCPLWALRERRSKNVHRRELRLETMRYAPRYGEVSGDSNF